MFDRALVSDEVSNALGLDRLPLESAAEQQDFFANLLCAAVWCRDHANIDDPTSSLRSSFLKPKLVLGDGMPRYAWDYKLPEPVAEVRELCRKRVQSAAENDGNNDSLIKGRLLLYWPEESLADGAASQSSNGFFDDWNMPPWDTWISLTKVSGGTALVSWVPSDFVGLVSDGVWANPEECIQWLRMDHQKLAYQRTQAEVLH
jgi:hypothetical protein